MAPKKSESSSAGADDAQIRQLSINMLDGDHHDLFTRAISRVLSTEIAEQTYAQIIDGLPLTGVIYESGGGSLPRDHPLHDVHHELCPGVLDKTRQFREEFDPQILSIDSRLLFAYQAAAPRSRAFKTRLIELVAVAVHQIAVLLFNLNTSLHKDDGITEWAPPKSDKLFWQFSPDGPLPTLFNHPWYVDYDQYPNGVADMVGYLTESRILGGVVVFDRRRLAPDFDRHAVYLHPDRTNVTYGSESPLPILCHDMNRNRVDPEEPIKETGIYRDLWERKPLPLDAPDGARMRDVWNVLDFPTMADKAASKRRAIARRGRYLRGEDDSDTY